MSISQADLPLKIEEASALCGWQVQTMRNRRAQGFPCPKSFKLPNSRALLFRRHDVERFIIQAEMMAEQA